MADTVMSPERAKARRKAVLLKMLRVLLGEADPHEQAEMAEVARRIDAEDAARAAAKQRGAQCEK